MILKNLLSKQTVRALKFDLLRFRARLKSSLISKNSLPVKLHFGCGSRLLPGWLNVDLINSDYDVDLSCGYLPFKSDHFEIAVSQHVIEHLDIASELLPLLKEMNRVMKSASELWLSCPDMEKICNQYTIDRGNGLLEDRQKRFPHFTLNDMPVQQIVNDLFHQGGEHKNLFDFELLKHILLKTGFHTVKKRDEEAFLRRFPEFSHRDDDFVSLYVSAVK